MVVHENGHFILPGQTNKKAMHANHVRYGTQHRRDGAHARHTITRYHVERVRSWAIARGRSVTAELSFFPPPESALSFFVSWQYATLFLFLALLRRQAHIVGI